MINLKFKTASNVLIITFIFIGFQFLIFPIISAFISDINTTRVIIDYEARTRAEEKYKSELLNNQLFSKINYSDLFNLDPDKFLSTKQKSYSNDKQYYQEGDMIGYLSIPGIDLFLPVYEGTSEAIIQKGVGHLQELYEDKTYKSICGKNKHCVLTSHSGLSKSRLFTDLEKMKIDDVFYLKIEDKFYEYKVMQINIVKPDKVKNILTVKKNKDYCSLITCTPICLNTERLVVTAERIKYDKKIDTHTVKKRTEKQYNICLLVCTSFLVVLFFISYIFKRKRILL